MLCSSHCLPSLFQPFDFFFLANFALYFSFLSSFSFLASSLDFPLSLLCFFFLLSSSSSGSWIKEKEKRKTLAYVPIIVVLHAGFFLGWGVGGDLTPPPQKKNHIASHWNKTQPSAWLKFSNFPRLAPNAIFPQTLQACKCKKGIFIFPQTFPHFVYNIYVQMNSVISPPFLHLMQNKPLTFPSKISFFLLLISLFSPKSCSSSLCKHRINTSSATDLE